MENLSVSSEDRLIGARKEKLVSFAKRNLSAIGYVMLALVVFIAIKIRTANLPGLKDITTGDWTLGPDLDPFLFLRWAKYIVENGSLMVMDSLRYVPLGFDTSYELNLHVYLIVWFHKLASIFGSTSITHSAVLYPVFMFALSVIAFFLMTRLIFSKHMGRSWATTSAIIASFLLTVTPALLPRTIAGIPEKEASGILFLFLAFYFFMAGWDAKKPMHKYLLGFLAGASTAVMGLVWGGYLYILITLGPLIFFSFALGQMDRERKYFYAIWLATTMILLFVGTKRYSLSELLFSTTTLPVVFMLAVIVVDALIHDTGLLRRIPSYRILNLPRPLLSIIITMGLGLLFALIFFGPDFVMHNVLALKKFLITTGTDRVSVTVAENRQPYFTEWAASFGPFFANFPLLFWMFFIGSILVFYQAIPSFDKKARVVMVSAFTFMLISLAFSRYSPTSLFNGTNFVSILFYAVGLLVFLGIGGKYYLKYYSTKELERLRSINFNFMLLLCFFIISVLSARGGVRLIMMLVPAASILGAYIVVETARWAQDSYKSKSSSKYFSVFCAVLLILSLCFVGYTFYNTSLVSAQGYVPSIYTQQWQRAMAWTRENTPQDAVFGHWWDYGYWVQSIGERATVLDGGNAKAYWNHMMGRYALTGTNNRQALDFLYAHNTTHFLIDPTDIGKYGAFSSIGSDKNYDRTSFISTFNKDPNQILEKKNSTVFVYAGGIPTDDDILYTLNGTKLFLPKGNAALGAIILEKDSIPGELTRAPDAVFFYKGNQYIIPLRYAFDETLLDFKEGLDAGIFIMPRLVSGTNGLQIQDDGSLLYLSNRTVHSQFARLYLYQEKNENFKLVHSEDDPLITQIRLSVPDFKGDFVNYDTVRGPIRIWEINYPADMTVKNEYLSEEWPAELFRT